MTLERLSNCASVLGDVAHPFNRIATGGGLSDISLLFADGTMNFGELISQTSSETGDSPGDRETENHKILLCDAVGEICHSEDEG